MLVAIAAGESWKVLCKTGRNHSVVEEEVATSAGLRGTSMALGKTLPSLTFHFSTFHQSWLLKEPSINHPSGFSMHL